MDDSPTSRPERDKRISDPIRFRHDRGREAEAMVALWERRRSPDAAEQRHAWRRTRLAVLQQISRREVDA